MAEAEERKPRDQLMTNQKPAEMILTLRSVGFSGLGLLFGRTSASVCGRTLGQTGKEKLARGFCDRQAARHEVPTHSDSEHVGVAAASAVQPRRIAAMSTSTPSPPTPAAASAAAPSLPLSSRLAVGVYLHDFQNLDLLAQGWYAIRCRVSGGAGGGGAGDAAQCAAAGGVIEVGHDAGHRTRASTGTTICSIMIHASSPLLVVMSYSKNGEEVPSRGPGSRCPAPPRRPHSAATPTSTGRLPAAAAATGAGAAAAAGAAALSAWTPAGRAGR
jgi:hypothetical protein